jgi:hypothetical protein
MHKSFELRISNICTNKQNFLVCANVSAVLTEIVVLPSPFTEDEIRITGHELWLLKKYLIFENNIRNDSAKTDKSFFPTTFSAPFVIFGISPTTGISLAIFWMSCLE